MWPLRTGTSCIYSCHDAFSDLCMSGNLAWIFDAAARLTGEHSLLLAIINMQVGGRGLLLGRSSWQPAAQGLLDATTGSSGTW